MSLPATDRCKRLRSAKPSPAPVVVRYLLRSRESTPIRVAVTNLTEQGCGLDSNTPLETGSQITVEGDLTGRGIESSVVARVAWCRSKGGGQYRAGVEFVDPPRVGQGGLWGRVRSVPAAAPVPAETPWKRAEAEQVLRGKILELLYNCRANAPESAELSLIEIEKHVGLPRNRIEFSLWYLRESGLAERSSRGGYGITIRGVHHFEATLARPD